MSELENRRYASIRSRILTTVSVAGLVGSACVSPASAQSGSGDAVVWVELGGQLERIEGGQELFAPDFAPQFAADGYLNLAALERLPRYSNGIEGSLRIAPRGSDWTFEISARYGRSNGSRTTHKQAAQDTLTTQLVVSIPAFGVDISQPAYRKGLRVADAAGQFNESHAIVDFQAGRDLGLGLFGGNVDVDLGVRVAQFESKSNTRITANPGGTVPVKYATTFAGYPANIRLPKVNNEVWNIYHASALLTRSFRGMGPSLGLSDSVPIMGRSDGMRADLEFGLNGAILIGRQKAVAHEKIYDDKPVAYHPYNFIPMTAVYHHRYDRVRSRVAVVPNIGGFAGVSFDYSNAKIKFGYRADLFLDAMDGGIESRKDYNRNFYGPFATISVGFGG